MANSPEFLDHLRDLFESFGPVSVRRMFGGDGVFRDGLMFAIVSDDTLYLKVDDENRPDFEAAGMEPFTYDAHGKQNALSYYTCPPDLLEDSGEFAAWARKAFDVALAAARKGAKKPGTRKG